MTADTKQATEKWNFLPDFMTENTGGVMKYAANVQMKLVQAGLDLQKDGFAFLQHRYNEDAKLANALMGAREPTDVMTTCAAFLQDALDDYSREAVKFANFGAEFAIGAADQAGAEMEAVAEQSGQAAEAMAEAAADDAPETAEAVEAAMQQATEDAGRDLSTEGRKTRKQKTA